MLNVSKSAKKEFEKLAKRAGKTDKVLKISTITGGCSAKVFIEQAKKEKDDCVIYDDEFKIYTGAESYDEVESAKVDFQQGGFEVKSRCIRNV